MSRADLAAVLALAALCAMPSAMAQLKTRYVLDLSERQAQVLGVRASFEGVESEVFTVHLPVWRTGLYRILDTVGTVSEIRVQDGAGNRLDFEQTAKSTWAVMRPDAAPGLVVFDYLVYAHSLNDRTRDVDADHALINPGLVLIYAESHRGSPVEVTTHLPEHWHIASGLESPTPERLIAPDYDRLVDSPIEMGTFELLSFEAADTMIEFAIHGDWDGDPERLEADVRAIVEAAAGVFGEVPTDRYVFLVHSAPGLRGGTEYYNSTLIHVEPGSFWDEDSYLDFLSLLTHEFFHLWNVKRFRPAGIARYDYLKENYTDLLWVAEGLTSYYDNILLVRSGVLSIKAYRQRLADTIDAVLDRPGYGRTSLAQASFEAWTKGYHPGADRRPDKINRTISFYDQGSLLGLVLDIEILIRSEGRYSLNDVLRSLYQDFPLDSQGYQYADVQERVERFGGRPLATALENWVLEPAQLPITETLAKVGWALTRQEKGPEITLGLRTRFTPGGQQVSTVELGGPAWRAGVNVDDVLLALDGVRIGEDLEALLKRHQAGDAVALTLFRRGRLRTLTVAPAAARRDHLVKPMEHDESATVLLRRAWLGGRVEEKKDD